MAALDNPYEIAARLKKVDAFLDAFDSILGRPIVTADMDEHWPQEKVAEVYRRAGAKQASDKTLEMLAERIRAREEKLKAGQVWSPREPGDGE